jgi:long-chain acyl-CoA synthetase
MNRNIPELFFKSAGQFKDNIAFNYFDQNWKTVTYGGLLIKAKRIASYLIKNGIHKGDRIAILSENRYEWCAAYLGISLSGGIAVPVDAQFGPDELENLIGDSESKMVFHSSKTGENISKALAGLSAVSSIDAANFDTPAFDDMCNTPDIGKYPELSEDDIASLIYTSGTTGVPKGVLLTHGNFCSDLAAILQAGIIEPGDNFIAILPYHHTYSFMGNFLLPISSGLSITFPPSLKGPELLSTMREKGVTILVGVPQLIELIRNGIIGKIRHLPLFLSVIMLGVLKISGKIRMVTGINPGKIIFKSAHLALGEQMRLFASGGAKLNPEVMKDLEALGFTVLEGFGLTETSPVVTFNSPNIKRKPGSIGKALPPAEIKIISPETRKEAGIMEEGEIVIRGPMVMKGYYKNSQATEEVLKDGWFHSGDLGYKDREGYIFVTGRLKEVIVLSSGKNIYPDEVESQYLKIPLIKEICVTGIEDKGMVESLQAIIVPDFEYAKSARIGNLHEALKWEINNVSLQLPQYMRIKGYTLYSDPLPRTPLGKLRRFMVKDLIKVKNEKLRVKRKEDEKLVEDKSGSKVVECIKPLLKEPIPVQSTDNLELDLGLDSLARIELVVALEKAFSMKLPETFASEIQTVGELVAKLKEYGTGGISEIEKMPAWKDILKIEPESADKRKVGLRHGLFDRLVIFIGLGLLKAVAKIFFRLRTRGIDNLPVSGPYILTPNHSSYLDGFMVIAALPSKSYRDLYTIGLQQFFTGNLKEVFARLAHIIPIDPEAYLTKALQMASFILRNKKSLLIFPEGGRSYDRELMEFKKGVGILSLELGVPVIPTCIKGAFEALPRGSTLPNFRAIEVIIGKPLMPSEPDFSKKPEGMDDYQFLAAVLKEKVRELEKLE